MLWLLDLRSIRRGTGLARLAGTWLNRSQSSKSDGSALRWSFDTSRRLVDSDVSNKELVASLRTVSLVQKSLCPVVNSLTTLLINLVLMRKDMMKS